MPPVSIPLLDGFAPLTSRYNAAIVDLWGVVHDGTAVYAGAIECLGRMGDAGIRRVLLSNAPRRAEAVADRIAEIGVAPVCYDEIVTSGDLTRAALIDGADPARPGEAYFHLGPERDRGIFEDLELRLVSDLAGAGFILNTGLFDDETEDESHYESFLAEAHERDLAMICANPDRAVIRGGQLVPCAGVLAAAYERHGGRVIYFGKPHRAAYRACFERLRGIAKRRIVAIGDGLHTDIAGANAAGIDSIFVAGGLHAAELAAGDAPDPARIQAACAAAGVRANAAMAELRW